MPDKRKARNNNVWLSNFNLFEDKPALRLYDVK